MKIINPERQTVTGSTITSADTNFPIANLFDNHPRNVTKANAEEETTIRVKIGTGSNAIAVFNTNADDVVCTITADDDEKLINAAAAATDETGGLVGIPVTSHGYSTGDTILLNATDNYDGVYSVHADTTEHKIVITATYAAETFDGDETVAIVQDTEIFDLQLIDTYARFFADNPLVYRRFWMDYTYQVGACTATITLTADAGTTVYAGVVKAGTAYEFVNPAYGLHEGRKSYDVKKRLNNGGLYGRTRNIVRTFSGEMLLIRAIDETDEYYKFMDIYDQFGEETPFAAVVVSGIKDVEWAVYCTFDAPIQSVHEYPDGSLVSFNWLEEI